METLSQPARRKSSKIFFLIAGGSVLLLLVVVIVIIFKARGGTSESDEEKLARTSRTDQNRQLGTDIPGFSRLGQGGGAPSGSRGGRLPTSTILHPVSNEPNPPILIRGGPSRESGLGDVNLPEMTELGRH